MTRIRLAVLGFLFTVLAILLGPSLGMAASEPPPSVELDADATSTVVLSAPVVTLIVSLLIPIVNGYLTKATTPSKVKAIGTILANVVLALIVNGMLVDGGSAISTDTLFTALIGAGVSILSYVGLYQPLGLTSSNRLDKATGQVVPGKLADKGVH